MAGGYTFFEKAPSTRFIVKNIAPHGKKIRIFNYPIGNGATRDLLLIPEISEETIRHSLLKGELINRLRSGEITIVDSDIDLLQFNKIHKDFLRSVGVRKGLEVSTANIGVLFKQNIELIGEKNDLNRTFKTPEKFINGNFQDNIFDISVKHNGRCLINNCDFNISESDGLGVGFNTVTFISFTPRPTSYLLADYVVEI